MACKFTKRKGVAGVDGFLIGEDVGKGQHEEHKGNTEHRFVGEIPTAAAFKSPRGRILFGGCKRPGWTSVADEPHQPHAHKHDEETPGVYGLVPTPHGGQARLQVWRSSTGLHSNGVKHHQTKNVQHVDDGAHHANGFQFVPLGHAVGHHDEC